MEFNVEWTQVQVRDLLLSEYTCEHDGKKAFVKMLSTQRWQLWKPSVLFEP